MDNDSYYLFLDSKTDSSSFPNNIAGDFFVCLPVTLTLKPGSWSCALTEIRLKSNDLTKPDIFVSASICDIDPINHLPILRRIHVAKSVVVSETYSCPYYIKTSQKDISLIRVQLISPSNAEIIKANECSIVLHLKRLQE